MERRKAEKSTEYRYFQKPHFSFVYEQIVSWEQIYFFFQVWDLLCLVITEQQWELTVVHLSCHSGVDCTGMKKTADRLEIEGSVELSDILSLST